MGLFNVRHLKDGVLRGILRARRNTTSTDARSRKPTMAETDQMPDSTPVPPATPDMAARLATNRTGRLTPRQHRLALAVGVFALAFLLCPLALLIQVAVALFMSDVPVPTAGGIIFTVLGVMFAVIFAGLVGTNAYTFLLEALSRHPVRYARGPLEIHVSAGNRPELPFSYIIGDYSFAPYVAPPDVPLRVGAPYLVYYSARSRLLLSLAALDAPDAAQWEPEF